MQVIVINAVWAARGGLVNDNVIDELLIAR